MGLKEAQIFFDNAWNTYYAGQTVNGRIEYTFDSPKKVRGIFVNLKGEAHTNWTESGSSDNNSNDNTNRQETTTDLSGHEEYFTITYYLLGSSSGNEIEIPAGKQVYNFTCTLPPVLPSSFEGQHGYVRYTVKVTLDRPWKFNQETKAAFTVINPLDLNLNPSYKNPIRMQKEKTFCCVCCASGPLSMDVQAPVSGYCPGQVIPVTIDIENNSNVQVHLVKVFLRKIVTYRATTPKSATKKSKDIITTVQEGPVPAGVTKHFELKIEVPSIPPSNLVNCNIIDLDYELKVECDVSGMHFNLKDKKYVSIGTVPLVGAAPPSPSQPAVLPVNPGAPPAYNPSAPAGEGDWVPPAGPGLYPTLAEPVYKESMYSARTIQDRGDNNYTQYMAPHNFAPHYPTYAAVLPPPLPK